MNGKTAMIRLVWKNYRLQRAFWICMGLLGIFMQLIGVMVRDSSNEQLFWLFGVAVGLPAFYALGCGATMFAGEHEAGTFDFQRGLPISPKRFFLSGFVFGILSIAGLLALLLISAILYYTISAWVHHASPSELPENMWPMIYGFWGTAILELFAWSLLFSLILKRPLIAVMLGIGCASVAAQMIARSNNISFGPYVEVYPGRIALAVVVLIVDFYLGCRWFRGESAWAMHFPRRRERKLVSSAIPVKTQYGFFRLFSRMAWQQARHSGWIWGLTLLGGIAMIVKEIPHFRNIGLLVFICDLAIVAMAVSFPLLGLQVFHQDQHRRTFLFFTERGVKPSRLWLSRQLAGFLPIAFLGIFYYLLFLVPLNFATKGFFPIPQWMDEFARHTTISNVPLAIWAIQIGLCFYHLLLLYSVGQCAAMFLRSGILATLGGVAGFIILEAWTFLMLFWNIPWQWSIAPLPILLLMATWLRTPGWLLERRDFRAWLRPAAVLLPMAAIILTVPFYRVFTIPVVEAGFSPEEFTQTFKPTPAALETVAMYEKAYELFEQSQLPAEPKAARLTSELPPPISPPEPWKPFGEPLSESETREAEAVRPALEIALAASKRMECNFYVDYPNFSQHSPANNAGWLVHEMTARARKLEAEGKLDDALECYLSVMRMQRQLSLHAPSYHNNYWEIRSQIVYGYLIGWAARPGQTVERILSALKQIQALPLDMNCVTNQIKDQYLRNRGILLDDRIYTDIADNMAKPGNANFKKDIDYYTVWRRVFPWERYRALRLMNQICSSSLKFAESHIRRIEDGEKVEVKSWYDHYRERDFALENDVQLPRIGYGYDYFSRELDELTCWFTRYRVLQVALAVEAWKIEHQEYPKTLDVLVGKYFEKLPVDPLSGKPFRYFPEGVPDRLRNVEIWSTWRYDNGANVYLEVNKPFLWSPGYNVRETWRYEETPILDRFILFESGQSVRPRSEEELLRRGWIFALP